MDFQRGCRTLPLWGVVLLACAPAASPKSGPSVAEDGSQNAAAFEAGTSAAAVSTSVEPQAAATATSGTAQSQRSLPFSWTHLQQEAVLSFALGKAPKVAALVQGAVLLFDGSTWRRLEALESARPGTQVQLFFGRDDAPRLMGFSQPPGEAEARPFYQRFKQGRFQPEPSELGPLAASRGRLYGVLGHDDPEVVCRQGSFCLVKRVTGWAKAPAHGSVPHIVLAGGDAFALHADHIERLKGEQWVPLTPARAWREPLALWLDPSGTPWVIERGQDALLTLVDGTWQAIAQPVREPRALWGSARNDLWIVGSSGAAHYNGVDFRVVDGVSAPLHGVAFSAPYLWLTGESGVFRGEPLPH
jgi:hypothetical protein